MTSGIGQIEAKGEIQVLVNKAFELSQQVEERAKNLSVKLNPICSMSEPKCDDKVNEAYMTDFSRILGNIIENINNTLAVINDTYNRLEI